ncbi:conserved Plasmodium protein, unknown function [Plasmodium sp. gorilla clade G2]|uniref:conserved Plasmodium protein, unknown function n=1 Tax=Plasmodium sp. gorilla clade G2 TaxID=880535 RepID=UPI000D203118|nr:conserved Plasmodium protein, unknown function [Plasmodium sp. gorilla clade G2]SOV14935.1 conserved Plasmodium protein, unknown function [Plasmodium sp. gorilla clade G2]
MEERSEDLMIKSKELCNIFLKSLKNDQGSVKYLNECKNVDISEFYVVFNLVFSNIITNDNNMVIYKDHLLFLSFCYMNKLIEKYYNIYSNDEKINIRNSFINILFSLPINYNHILDTDILNLKIKSNEMFKTKLINEFLNEQTCLMNSFFNKNDIYMISTYMNSTRNKISQILSIICLHNEHIYFRYLLNFLIFFICEYINRIILCKSEYNNGTINENNNVFISDGLQNKSLKDEKSDTIHNNNMNNMNNMNNNLNNIDDENYYFNCVLHICINFLKEIFYNISNENYSNMLNKQQLNMFRTIIITDINIIFHLISLVFYYCLCYNKKNEFSLLIESIKELSFFFPAHIFFNEANSPIKFLLNILILCFKKNKSNINHLNQNNNSIRTHIPLNHFEILYKNYLSSNDSNITHVLTHFLEDVDVEEILLIIFLNIIEYISKINNKTFFQLNEDEFMLFLDTYFNINLNFHDIEHYTFQKIYIKMIMNLSCIPISNYLHKKENKFKCLHIFIINIFKNINHPNTKILINILTICKNIFDHNKDLIYINNKYNIEESKLYNIYKTDREHLFNHNNQKDYHNNQLIISCDDLKKLFILMFIRFIKIPIYDDYMNDNMSDNMNNNKPYGGSKNNKNEQKFFKISNEGEQSESIISCTNACMNKKLMIDFINNYITEYNEDWFYIYYKNMKEECEENDTNNINDYDENENILKQKIFNFIKVLLGYNHEIYHIMIDVFDEFFIYYNTIINVNNLCNETLKVQDYFIYVLLRAYYQLLSFFINTLKELKNIVTNGDKQINENIFSYQMTCTGEREKELKEAFIQNKINMKNNLEEKIIQMNNNNIELENNHNNNNSGNLSNMSCNTYNLDMLKREKENIELEIFIIKCIEKYQGSPYYEINNKCINKLLNFFKIILQKDFMEFNKISTNFVLFEIKRLQHISECTYILNYNKDYAYFIMDNLMKTIIENTIDISFELKKNYLAIFTSIIMNLESFLSNDIIEKILKTFLDYKKSTNIFKYNKEFSIFLLTLISVLKVDNINQKVPYIKLVLEDTYEFFTHFNKNINTFQKLYDLFYVQHGNDTMLQVGSFDSIHKKEDMLHSLFDACKIVHASFSLFSYEKNDISFKSKLQKRILNQTVNNSTNDNMNSNNMNSNNNNSSSNKLGTHVNFGDENMYYNLMNDNNTLINDNEFLHLFINLFENVLMIYSIFNDMIRTNYSFEKYPKMCVEVNYFHLTGQEKDIVCMYNMNKKRNSIDNMEHMKNMKDINSLNYNDNMNNMSGNNELLYMKNNVCIEGKKCNYYTIKLLHENICNIIKKFIKESYFFIYNDLTNIFNNILCNSLIYIPYDYINNNILLVYVSLSEKLKYLINNKLINQLIIQWFFKIFSVFLEKHFHYFREEYEHIKKVNSELNSEICMKEDDYSMYYDMLYKNKNYILNYLKICKNIFVVPNEYKNNQEHKMFFQYIYNDEKTVLLNSLLSTIEYLLNSYDCDITKKCLNFLVDSSESVTFLTFNSSHFYFFLQIIKVLLKTFFLYNPIILTLRQKKEENQISNIILNEYTEEKIQVYIGEMNLFMKNDPLEANSFLNVFTNAIIKISKHYFFLQKKIYNIPENVSTNDLLNIDSVKHFLLLFENIENSSTFNFHTILSDLLQQNNSQYFKNLLIQYRLHKT